MTFVYTKKNSNLDEIPRTLALSEGVKRRGSESLTRKKMCNIQKKNKSMKKIFNSINNISPSYSKSTTPRVNVFDSRARSGTRNWLPVASRSNEAVVHANSKRANKYLNFQFKRIDMLIAQNKFDKAFFIWVCLFKNSISYQLWAFNKHIPKWYFGWNQKNSKKMFTELVNKCRKMDLQLELKRFYVQKPNGKWRPIGSPSLVSRCISGMVSDITYRIMEFFRDEHQHGYRKGRGTWSAVLDIIATLSVNDKANIYEFDLTSFFNTVKPSWIFRTVKIRSPMLAEMIMKILTNIKYDINELMEEKELKYLWTLHRKIPKRETIKWHGTKLIRREHKAKNKVLRAIERCGLPQGLSMSPYLCTLALNINPFKFTKLVMYADDGLFLTNQTVEEATPQIEDWFHKLDQMGIEKSEEKSFWAKRQFKFAGYYIDRDERTVEFQDQTGKQVRKSWEDEDLVAWLKTAASKYGKKPSLWAWDVKPDSYITCTTVTLKLWQKIWIIILGFWKRSWKGYRYIIGYGIYDVMTASSHCTSTLLRESKHIKFAKRGKINVYEPKKWFGHNEDKGYIEFIHENCSEFIVAPKDRLSRGFYN
jgi:hypothetical protein